MLKTSDLRNELMRNGFEFDAAVVVCDIVEDWLEGGPQDRAEALELDGPGT